MVWPALWERAMAWSVLAVEDADGEALEEFCVYRPALFARHIPQAPGADHAAII